MTRRLRSLMLMLLVITGTSSASDVSEAIHAMRAGNFAEAFCVLKPYAESGDAEAQYNIGWMYLNGYGLAMNDSIALDWWQRASDQGYTDATFSIAMLYSLGEGQVKKDMKRAIDYYLMAVEGQVKKDMERAIDYYLMAVEDGHEDAIMIVRSMLARNDKAIRERKQDIIKTYGYLLGPLFDVKVNRANLRSGPTLEDKIVTVLETGVTMVELSAKGKWKQVGILDSGDVAWIYSTLLQPHMMMSSGNEG